jgi:hypothetical protein
LASAMIKAASSTAPTSIEAIVRAGKRAQLAAADTRLDRARHRAQIVGIINLSQLRKPRTAGAWAR